MSLMGQTLEPNSFGLLDGLRGMGAILILMGHTVAFWGLQYVPTGAVCVDLFFLLSGFVIAFAYEPRFATGMGVRQFMMHRIVRLYPLYVLSIVMSLVLGVFAIVGDANAGARIGEYTGTLFPQLFMLPAHAEAGKLYPLNGPAWTLFSELLVNLVFVLIWPWLSTRVLVVIVAVAAFYLTQVVIAEGGIDGGASWASFWAGPARAFFGFFAGVLTFRLIGSPARPGPRRSLWVVPLLLVLPALCFIPVPVGMQPLFDISLVVILGMPLLFLSQGLQPPRAFVGVFTWLGRISYGIYILHAPLREVLHRIHWRVPELTSNYAPLAGIGFLIVVLAVAHVTERFYDRPVRRAFVGMVREHAKRSKAKIEADRPNAESPVGTVKPNATRSLV